MPAGTSECRGAQEEMSPVTATRGKGGSGSTSTAGTSRRVTTTAAGGGARARGGRAAAGVRILDSPPVNSHVVGAPGANPLLHATA